MAVFTVIDHTDFGASASEWEETGISGSYDHLYLVASLRSDRATNYDTLALQLNGETGTDYSYTRLYCDGSLSNTVRAARVSGAAHVQLYDITGATNTADTFANLTVWIPHYANTANYKQVMGFLGRSTMSAVQYYWNEAFTGGMMTADTAAITEIRLFPTTGPNFVQYSSVTLYGVTGV